MTLQHPALVAPAQDPSARPLPGCIVMSDGRFKFSTEQQQAAFVHRQAGAVLPYYEAARVANSFYAKQHGCGIRGCRCKSSTSCLQLPGSGSLLRL